MECDECGTGCDYLDEYEQPVCCLCSDRENICSKCEKRLQIIKERITSG